MAKAKKATKKSVKKAVRRATAVQGGGGGITPTAIVNVSPISTNFQINSDNVVALLVSQAEESIVQKEKNTQKKINDVSTSIKAATTEENKAWEELRNNKEKELKKIDFLTPLKALGIPKTTISVDVRSSDDSNVVFVVRVQSENGASINGVIKEKPPAELTKIGNKLNGLRAEKQKLTDYLIELRAYRQNELNRLERWARGQVAAKALEEAGGDMAVFAEKFESLVPQSLRNLLE